MRLQNMERIRITLLVVVVALVASTLTLFARTPDASACSIAPPMLEVAPADSLEPGEALKVRGSGFNNIIVHPWEEEYDADGNPIPQHSCAGIEIVPMEVVVNWIGQRSESLAVVKGPDFSIEVAVPKWAEPGPASIEANGFEAYVYVAGDQPCPVNMLDGADQGFVPAPLPPECPDPCLGGPEIDVRCPEPCPANGFDEPRPESWPSPGCPEPCPANGFDEPRPESWPSPGCPEPCGWTLDDPNRPPCQEPEPCLDYVMGFEGDHPPELPDCPLPCPLDSTIRLEDSGANESYGIWPADCSEPCWGAADILCPAPEPIPLPEPFPDPLPFPEPLPMPIQCLLQPDGAIICPAVLSAYLGGADDGAAIDAVEPVVSLPPVPAPPRPFIDFDGCRFDGADVCR